MTISNEEVGKRIRQAREYRGLTQDNLAEIIETTQETITNYEKGRRMIPLVIAIEIQQALDVSFDYFIGKTATMTQKNHLLQ